MITRIVLAAIVLGTGTAARQTPPFTAYLMEESREIAIARSAAPAVVSTRAGLFVLRKDGRYQLVSPSANGFNCLIQRSFTVPTTNPAEFYEPRLLAPICFNAEASASVMQRDLWIAPLVAGGTPLAEIRRMETEAYASGRLKYPSKTAIAYMLSSAQWLGPNVQHWHPHIMVWAPGLSADDLVPADVGRFDVSSGYPIMDSRYGLKQPLIAIPTRKSIDPVFGPGRETPQTRLR